MAKKHLRTKINLNIFKYTKDETKQAVFGIIFFILGVFLVLSAFGKSGIAGEKIHTLLRHLLGVGYLLLPLFSFVLSLTFFKNFKQTFHISKIIFSLFAILAGLGLIDLFARGEAGIIGQSLSTPLVAVVDLYASFIILFGIFIIFLILTIEPVMDTNFFEKLKKLLGRNKKTEKEQVVLDKNEQDKINVGQSRDEDSGNEEKQTKQSSKKSEKILDDKDEFFVNQKRPSLVGMAKYVPIPLSLLERDKGKPGVGDIKANANIIKRTLQNFGINVEMDEISIGPSVTRYALKPAEGVKLSRIVGLQNDLALALAAHPIRIEAPIPGKSLVGIEIPNSTKTTVGLGTMLSSPEYQESDKSLLLSLGKGVSGKCHFANLGKMPHLLIAGATGSGKSVAIHSIITSMLYRNSPENLKFIMIDPKRVELTLYNKIPHLLTPVITDAKKAILALKWAAKEMNRRYDILEAESVRDIESYHKNILEPELKKMRDAGVKNGEEEVKMPETMPYIAIIIDELADIMSTYPRELESAIVRLAQMSRAVGIHLILSTQRPSVNIITGLIKANIPTRVALQVSSQIDSRTILDTSGAEKLLGAGDMLYLGGEMSKPQRLQSAFISESEVKSVVKFLSENYSDILPSDISFSDTEKNSIFESTMDDESLEDEDEMYEDARVAVLEARKASTSYLQRKLGLGYARAARIMDMLEQKGVIGPADGAKPREVYGEGETSDEEPSQEEV